MFASTLQDGPHRAYELTSKQGRALTTLGPNAKKLLDRYGEELCDNRVAMWSLRGFWLRGPDCTETCIKPASRGLKLALCGVSVIMEPKGQIFLKGFNNHDFSK